MNEQAYLDQITAEDKYGFLKDVEHFCNHRPLLWLGLHLIDPLKDVVEFGSGHGSTKYLRDWCSRNGIYFNSYDNNPEWCEKTGSQFVEDWEAAPIYQSCGLILIDHAPGEHRHIAAAMMAQRADIVVLHDAEETGSGNYQYEKVYPMYKYKLGHNLNGGGAGCSMVSNTIDLHVFKGLKLGGYDFE